MKNDIVDSLANKHVYMVGIKGTGMTAFVEILKSYGAIVTGSDIPDQFYTDQILKDLGIKIHEEFSNKNIDSDIDWLIYSAAYSPESHPEIQKAKELNILVSSYPEALGMLSQKQFSVGVAGVHGKTTTTALIGRLCQFTKFPAMILVGSQVPDFQNHCTCILGSSYFIAETCEYREHFLKFSPSVILLTSVELDHPDYFESLDHIKRAFQSYIAKLPPKGTLVYCADDENILDMVNTLKNENRDICFFGYGRNDASDFQIFDICLESGKLLFKIKGIPREFLLQVPGIHNVFNAAGALAVMTILFKNEKKVIDEQILEQFYQGLAGFHGTKRRSELIGEAGGIIFIDDYAHHPTAIKTTLSGIKSFYPQHRLVVDFMSHTYSRTQRLFDDFASSFESADTVIIHKIYASAREIHSDKVSGRVLADAIEKHRDQVFYFEDFQETQRFLENYLHEGDIFVTMGAGDNWKIGYQLYQKKGDISK